MRSISVETCLQRPFPPLALVGTRGLASAGTFRERSAWRVGLTLFPSSWWSLMPWAPARRCTRCRASFTGTRCPTCHPSWANRPSSWPGGSTRRWRNVRSAQLVEHPLCAFCGALADTVDHIDGTDYATQRYDPTMVRSLCTDCHDERTRQQSADARSTKE